MITILTGNVLDTLPTLPSNSVQCCVTSPPYWGLRSYLPDGHADKGFELGSEATPQEYVANMVAVFREVRRVLREDGTLWLNLGSSYVSGIIESQEYVLRDDLTTKELAYVYSELAKHTAAEPQALPDLRQADESTEQEVSRLLRHREGAA